MSDDTGLLFALSDLNFFRKRRQSCIKTTSRDNKDKLLSCCTFQMIMLTIITCNTVLVSVFGCFFIHFYKDDKCLIIFFHILINYYFK